MKKSFVSIILLMLTIVSFICIDAKADSVTIATFADPSRNSGNPLFTVDFLNSSLIGGWSDAKTGLTLEIPYSGNNFSNAWFDMTSVSIDSYGDTGSGTIRFFEDGKTTDPLVVIYFTSGSISRFGFGADEFVANDVTITGSKITDALLDEQFAFSFANKKKLSGPAGLAGGFTATAAFTSSAINPIIPEPATICILGLGALSLIRRKK